MSIDLEAARYEAERLTGSTLAIWGMSGDPAHGTGKWRFQFENGSGFEVDVTPQIRAMSTQEFAEKVLRPALVTQHFWSHSAQECAALAPKEPWKAPRNTLWLEMLLVACFLGLAYWVGRSGA